MNVATQWDWMGRRRFLAVPMCEAVDGDLYANGGTITAVHIGPCETGETDWRDSVPAGKTMLICGDSFSTMGDSDNPVIVGRMLPPEEWPARAADPPAPEPEAAPADEMVSVKLPRHLVEIGKEITNGRTTLLDLTLLTDALPEACAAALTEDDRGADR